MENKRYIVENPNGSGPKLVIEKLPDKKLPQLFVVENNVTELLATFQSDEKAETFIKKLSVIVC